MTPKSLMKKINLEQAIRNGKVARSIIIILLYIIQCVYNILCISYIKFIVIYQLSMEAIQTK